MKQTPLVTERRAYKPFSHPWAYEFWKVQQQVHWLPEEVPMSEDIKDWDYRLTAPEKNLLTQIFRFFTQADVEVNDCYHRNYMRLFKNPEVGMMLTAFSNMETIHVAAYSHLLDTVGMPEAEYSAFLDYQEMREKSDYLSSFNPDDPLDVATTLAVFGAFTEGLSLFASFAMLMNFPRFNKMKGMGQIVSWSVRDETLHMNGIVKLFHEFVREQDLDRTELITRINSELDRVIEAEDKFIDLVFEMGPVEGLTADEMKQYIRYIANQRLEMLWVNPRFDVWENPLPWLEEILNGVEHANFFEARATEYSKGTSQGTWSDDDFSF